MRASLLLACAALGGASAAFAADDVTRVPVVLHAPGMDRAFVLEAERFGTGGGRELLFDAYYPGPERPREALPAIVFVSGGERVRDWAWYESYGRLAAAHGWVGIVPDKRYPRGLEGTRTGRDDTVAFLAYLKAHAADLGVDPERVCVWVFSAGGRMAAVPLNGDGMEVAALVAYYAVLDAGPQVQDGAAGRDTLLARLSPLHAVEAGRRAVPRMLVVRAGQDGPGINEGIERFTMAALRANLDLELINFPAGVHGFDGYDDSDASRAVIVRTFRWIAEALAPR